MKRKHVAEIDYVKLFLNDPLVESIKFLSHTDFELLTSFKGVC